MCVGSCLLLEHFMLGMAVAAHLECHCAYALLMRLSVVGQRHHEPADKCVNKAGRFNADLSANA